MAYTVRYRAQRRDSGPARAPDAQSDAQHRPTCLDELTDGLGWVGPPVRSVACSHLFLTWDKGTPERDLPRDNDVSLHKRWSRPMEGAVGPERLSSCARRRLRVAQVGPTFGRQLSVARRPSRDGESRGNIGRSRAVQTAPVTGTCAWSDGVAWRSGNG